MSDPSPPPFHPPRSRLFPWVVVLFVAALALTVTAAALGLAEGFAQRAGPRPVPAEADGWIAEHAVGVATVAAVIAWVATAALSVFDTARQDHLLK